MKSAVNLGVQAGKIQKLVLHERILAAASKVVDSTQLRGKLINNIVEAATGLTQTARVVEGSLQQKIFNDADAVRALAIQIIAVLNAYDDNCMLYLLIIL